MSPLAPSTASQNNESSRALLAELLSNLQASQNSDGGWAFYAGSASRVEPTCWALLALANSSESSEANIAGGLSFLQLQQLADGSWPAASGISSGGWVTSLAALTLTQISAKEKSVQAALQWLCDDYPRDSSRWQKFLKSLGSAKQHVSHNDEFRGWGWTPRTSSWVEPTSFALLAFSSKSSQAQTSKLEHPDASRLPSELAKQISKRRTLAIGLLYDRMCAGGGWNCGNPRVYGVAGESLVLPTCWALLALREAPEHPNRAISLDWLKRSFEKISSAGSLAIAQVTLERYGVAVSGPSRLTNFSATGLAEQGTHVAAWTALALNSSRIWPAGFHDAPSMSRQAQE